MDTYNVYRVEFFRAGLFRFSQELIYDIKEGEQAIRTKISHFVKSKERDGEKFDEAKIEMIRTFQR